MPEKSGLRVTDLEDAIRAAVPPGEYLIHYEIIVQTRAGVHPEASYGHSGTSEIITRRTATEGSDPHLSLGVLTVQAAVLNRKILGGEP